MTRGRILILSVVVVLLLLGAAGAGAWFYLFGPNKISADEMVPSDTVFFATIPNAVNIAAGYQTSQLKQLVDNANSKPISDAIAKGVGDKYLDLLNTFLPNLSGQSFIAVTYINSDKPGDIGFIAGFKPKPGTGNFNAFVDKLKATYPEIQNNFRTGTSNFAGLDYQWLKNDRNNSTLCVAQVGGWTITTWGEAPMQDWVQRYYKKSTIPSLAKNPDYQKAIASLDKDSMGTLYVDYHAILELIEKQMAKTNRSQSEYLEKRFGTIGGIAMGSSFQNGEIVDRISLMVPKSAQADMGIGVAPCAFETLKFTGPTTRLYWATALNWHQYWKNLDEKANQAEIPDPVSSGIVRGLNHWTQAVGLDLQKNIIDALGDETSVQLEWNDDQSYPELGIFIKVAKPDDFKPTIDTLVNELHDLYINSAVITELNSNGQAFSSIKFTQPLPLGIVPTITKGGPYFGLFTSENLAARSFARDDAATLPHNADFARQIGDKRNGATQISFIDSPKLLDRTYKTVMPYLSILSMFNKNIAAAMQNQNLPPDLTWLAPMGTWSTVTTATDDGVMGYSVSGIGNQGVYAAIGGVGLIGAAQMSGMLPKMSTMMNSAIPAPSYPTTPPAPAPANPAATPAPSPAPSPTDATAPATNATTAPSPSIPAPPAPDTTAAPPPAAPVPSTNAAPVMLPTTNSAPAMLPSTNAPTPAPDASKSQ
jgi:hypothetical protein